MAKQTATYQKMSTELDDILTELQQEDLDVEKALSYYERGLFLIKELENYLADAENQVKQLKTKLSD